ncbi:MAG: 50S ribosomal protein L18 [Candidatus Omnitrophica bacterium]|nr:50S ribosomal protein L18 [Candidatus Omnitrophota bacterium]MDE2008507.1 50S ribosomal protein L18 [Candidatus Omnitrophota bacterium]MDE2213973.1 50S ribosomal protein L18 [Candidatus Omnitrophota bacterium]MDE2231372.1 50S ribosomal protein L18 [Candidatus Omnitrophota bacterium]
MLNIKEQKRVYRHQRIRGALSGTTNRPRLCLHRSLNNLQAQIIDDSAGKVLLGKSTLAKDVKSKFKTGGNISAAGILGEAVALEAIKKGIKKVAFDRGGYLYHGRIKAFAEAARKAGLEF